MICSTCQYYYKCLNSQQINSLFPFLTFPVHFSRKPIFWRVFFKTFCLFKTKPTLDCVYVMYCKLNNNTVSLTSWLTYSLTSIQIFRHVPVSYPHETYLKLPNLNLSKRFSTLNNPRKKLCAKCRCTRNPLSGLGEASVKLNTKRST